MATLPTVLPTSIPAKRLTESITPSSTSFEISDILKWDGSDLTSADLGEVAYGAFRDVNGTVLELFSYDPTTIADDSITFVNRGLSFSGDRTTEVTINKLTWTRGTTVVELGSDFPQLYQYLIDYINNIAVSGAPVATTSVLGISKASVAPASPSAPIFVGDNDPRVPSTNGAQFVAAAVGMIVPYAGVSAPSGFLLCDGTTYDADTYPALALITAGNYGYGSQVTYTVVAATDIFTATSHGLTNGSILFFQNVGGALPTGLSVNTPYYVITATTNTFQVSTTSGGTTVDITSTGSGTNTFSNGFKVPDMRGGMMLGMGTKALVYAFASATDISAGAASGTVSLVNTGSGTITTSTSHGLTSGDPIILLGTTPAGVTPGLTYFAGVTSSTSFRLYPTSRDALASTNLVALGDTQTGATVFARNSIFTMPAGSQASQFYTGQAITIATSSALPTNLTAGAYNVIRLSQTTFQLATSAQNARDIIPVIFSTTGTGTQTVTGALTTRPIGEMAGHENVVIGLDQLPHNIGYNFKSRTDVSTSSSGTALISETDTVQSNAVNLMPPYVAVNFIIKT